MRFLGEIKKGIEVKIRSKNFMVIYLFLILGLITFLLNNLYNLDRLDLILF